MKDKTDKDLFIGIANSHQKCWVELVRRYANLIYLVSLHILNNDADAEDAMQNVFIKIQKCASIQCEPVLDYSAYYADDTFASKRRGIF